MARKKKQESENQPTGWVHPTGKVPERICILGLGATAADWHAAHVQYTPPLAPVDEVWTVNKGARTNKADLVFVMDDLVEESRRSPRYGEDIASWNIPVITSTTDVYVKERWPKALRYPLEEVLEHYGGHMIAAQTGETKINRDEAFQKGLDEAYFHNSIPYMLAYAGMIGVKNIALFGVDYNFDGNPHREDDRANCEFWIGALQYGKGVIFQYPHRTTICNRNKGRWFYGFNGRQPY